MDKNEQVPQKQPQLPPDLTVEQALQNLANISGEVKATRQEHLIIQMSLQKIAIFIRDHTAPLDVKVPQTDPEK